MLVFCFVLSEWTVSVNEKAKHHYWPDLRLGW